MEMDAEKENWYKVVQNGLDHIKVLVSMTNGFKLCSAPILFALAFFRTEETTFKTMNSEAYIVKFGLGLKSYLSCKLGS
jgi:hypothetical protein